MSKLKNYLLESKRLTSKDRHLYRFKKSYNFRPIGKDKTYGKITVDGSDYNVDIDINNPHIRTWDNKNIPRETISEVSDKNGTIHFSNSDFRLKPKQLDSILQHEIGHTKMHYINPDTLVGNKQYASNSVADVNSRIMRDKLYNATRKQYELPDVKNALYDDKYFRNENEKIEKERRKNIAHMQKYVNCNNGATPLEFEADQYSMHKNGKSNLKRALRNKYKINKKKNLNKKYNTIINDHITRRYRALDDENLKKSTIYK